MGSRPDMILQFAHFLSEEVAKSLHKSDPIYVRSFTRLNGRPPQLLVDPKVDLSQELRNLRHASWIFPLKEVEDPKPI